MNIRPLKSIIDDLNADRANSAAREAALMQAGRDSMAPLADLRNGGNLPARRVSWLVPVAVLLGMALFAALVHADPIGRTADVIANPHLEGFE